VKAQIPKASQQSLVQNNQNMTLYENIANKKPVLLIFKQFLYNDISTLWSSNRFCDSRCWVVSIFTVAVNILDKM